MTAKPAPAPTVLTWARYCLLGSLVVVCICLWQGNWLVSDASSHAGADLACESVQPSGNDPEPSRRVLGLLDSYRAPKLPSHHAAAAAGITLAGLDGSAAHVTMPTADIRKTVEHFRRLLKRDGSGAAAGSNSSNLMLFELQLPGVAEALAAADRLAEGPVCTTAQLHSLLTELLQALQRLQELRITTTASSHPIVRRYVAGFMWLSRRVKPQLWDGRAAELQEAISVKLFVIHQQGMVDRQAIEFFHISKSGGTTMCNLARINSCVNPAFDEDRNCMIGRFNDTPKWTLPVTLQPLQGWNVPLDVGPTVNCAWWPKAPEVSCTDRKKYLHSQGYNFYAVEHTLHGGSPDAAAAHTCPGLINVISLREPMSHMRSLLTQVRIIFKEYLQLHISFYVRRTKIPDDLDWWVQYAPAVLDNYYLRSLLGRHLFCAPFGSLTDEHLRHGERKLMTFDVLLSLGEDDANDVALQVGLGWQETLRYLKTRTTKGKEHSVGNATFLQTHVAAIRNWNRLDTQLYELGKAMAVIDAQLFGSARSVLYRRLQAQRNMTTDSASSTVRDVLSAAECKSSKWGCTKDSGAASSSGCAGLRAGNARQGNPAGCTTTATASSKPEIKSGQQAYLEMLAKEAAEVDVPEDVQAVADAAGLVRVPWWLGEPAVTERESNPYAGNKIKANINCGYTGNGEMPPMAVAQKAWLSHKAAIDAARGKTLTTVAPLMTVTEHEWAARKKAQEDAVAAAAQPGALPVMAKARQIWPGSVGGKNGALQSGRT